MTPNPSPAQKGSGKIVVAEDDLVTRRLVTQVCRSAGYTAIETSDGMLALEILKDNPDTQLLITDMMMPRLDGRELVVAVRNEKLLAQIPIIIVSGVVKLTEIVDLLENGASRFMPKPIVKDDLAAYIQQLTVK